VATALVTTNSNSHSDWITLHVNDSLPIKESNWHSVHLWCWSIDCNDEIRYCLHSSGMLAVMVEVLFIVPRNVRWVVGPSIFEDFTGACILWHNESIVYWLLAHS